MTYIHIGAAGAAAPTVTGDWAGDATGKALCVALASQGIIIDSTTNGSGLDAYTTAVLATTGLTNYWRLGEASGLTATATTGSVNGTYSSTGITYSATGPTGAGTDTAVTLDGAAGQITAGTSAGNFSGTQAFSVECWLKFSANPATGKRVINRFTNASNLPGWGLGLDTTGKASMWRSDGTTPIGTTANAAMSTSVWHHLVGVFTGSLLSIYVDGALGTTGSAATSSLASSATTLCFGAEFDASGNWLAGSIDEVALYNVALPLGDATTAGSIAYHYAKGIGAP